MSRGGSEMEGQPVLAGCEMGGWRSWSPVQTPLQLDRRTLGFWGTAGEPRAWEEAPPH